MREFEIDLTAWTARCRAGELSRSAICAASVGMTASAIVAALSYRLPLAPFELLLLTPVPTPFHAPGASSFVFLPILHI